MSRSSRHRGQTEPLVALVAVFAITVGLVAYAGVFESVVPNSSNHDIARPTLGRAYSSLAPAGVVDPKRFDSLDLAGPDGYQVQIILTVEGTTRQTGPPVPTKADRSKEEDRKIHVDRATRSVSVRLRPGVIRSGELTVIAWR